MIPINPSNIILSRHDYFNFKVFMDETNFVITAPKVGSRFLLYLFKKKDIDIKLPSRIHSAKDLETSADKLGIDSESLDSDGIEYDFDLYVESVLEEWSKILKGESSKNLIILYRHPIERFKTAVIQDFAQSIIAEGGNGIIYLKELILNQGFSEEQAMMFLTQFAPSLHSETGMEPSKNNNYYEMYNECEPIFQYILKVYLSHAVKYGTGHYNDYLSVFNTLVQTNIIKNPKYINLESKGELEKYFDYKIQKLGPTKPQIHSNKNLGKKVLDNILIENHYLRDTLHRFLKEDLVIYSILNTNINGL